jgi:hypothetical protein
LAARVVKGSSEAVRRFSHRIVSFERVNCWGCGELVGWTEARKLGNVALRARDGDAAACVMAPSLAGVSRHGRGKGSTLDRKLY